MGGQFGLSALISYTSQTSPWPVDKNEQIFSSLLPVQELSVERPKNYLPLTLTEGSHLHQLHVNALHFLTSAYLPSRLRAERPNLFLYIQAAPYTVP